MDSHNDSGNLRGTQRTLDQTANVSLACDFSAAARNANFSDLVASVTHHGAALRVAGRLDRYCELAEQDTLNYMLAQRPDLWRPLECAWNYMAAPVGGHALVADDQAELTFYDVCTDGPRGARGAPAGDLLPACPCGRRVELLHFAGGVRTRPLLGQINASVLAMSGEALRDLARRRARRPRLHSSVAKEEL